MKKRFNFLLFVLPSILLCINIYTMDLKIDINDVDIFHYYHHENKELNFSNLLLGDANLAILEPLIKTFVESVGVERLIIENADLKTVPFNLIGFTLISKTLKYVSFLGNKFVALAGAAVVDEHGSASVEEVTRPRADSLMASTVSSVWGNLSPEIERILKEHNSNGSKFHYYNKIIFIDRTMPPITILDAKRAPYTKYERIKYIMVRVGLFGLGVVITLAPSIIPWLLSTDENSD